MDISTKCGIDSSAVWAAWGMMKLKAGDYTGARDKFAKCLKVSQPEICLITLLIIINNCSFCPRDNGPMVLHIAYR